MDIRRIETEMRLEPLQLKHSIKCVRNSNLLN